MKTKDDYSGFQLIEVAEVEDGECIVLIEETNDVVETLFFNPNSSSISTQTDLVVFSNALSFPILFCSQPSFGEASTLCNIPHKLDVGTSTMQNDLCTFRNPRIDNSHYNVSSNNVCHSNWKNNLSIEENTTSKSNVFPSLNQQRFHKTENELESQSLKRNSTLDTSFTNVNERKSNDENYVIRQSVLNALKINVEESLSYNLKSFEKHSISDNKIMAQRRRRGRPPKNESVIAESKNIAKKLLKEEAVIHTISNEDTPNRRKRKKKHDADFEYDFPGKSETLNRLDSLEEGLISVDGNDEVETNDNIYVGSENLSEFDTSDAQEDLTAEKGSKFIKYIEEDSLLTEIKQELNVMTDNSYLNSEFSNSSVDGSNEFIDENFDDNIHQVDTQETQDISDAKYSSKIKDSQSLHSQKIIKVKDITFNVKPKVNISEKTKKNKTGPVYLNSASLQRENYSKQKVVLEDGKIVYRCYKCNLDFDKRIKLKVHCRSHTKSEQNKTFTCEQCGKYCKDYRKYVAHISFHNRTFKCETCNRNFALLANLKKHILLHPEAPDQVCDICGAQFSTPENLKDHFDNQHRKDALRMYAKKCIHCGKEYMRQRAYEKHISEAPYMCSICNKYWGCEYSLKRHLSLTHSQCVCEFCGKSVKKGALAHHVRLHMEANVPCPHCPKKFTFRSKMLAHVDANHNNEKKYKCNLCKYTAKTANTVNLHRRMYHTHPSKRRSYPCDMCDKEFHLPSKLELHYRSHTGEKPFKCGVCNKGFSSKFNMNDHMKCVHGESVELLQPDGSTSVKVIKHRRAPRGSGRRCDLCGSDFPSSATLLQHIRDVHHAHPVEQREQHIINHEHISIEVQDELSNNSHVEIDSNSGIQQQQQQQYGIAEKELEESHEANSSVVSIPADAIPEYATHVQINGVEYQVLRH